MNFSSYISKRYLFAKRNFQFVTLISRLSLIGISVGIASLIIVLSIFNGFQEFTLDSLISNTPHLKIYQIEKDQVTNLLNESDIVSIHEAIEGKAILSNDDKRLFVKLIAVEGDSISKNKINVTGSVIRELRIDRASRVNVQTPEMLKASFATMRPRKNISLELEKELEIVSSYSSTDIAYVSWEIKKSLFGRKAQSFVELELSDPDKVDEIKSQILKLHPNVTMISWKDLNSKILFMMEFEHYASFLILGLIVLIAVFNLFAALSMTVFEKIRDISLLRVLGANNKQIHNLFLKLGMSNGLLGIFLGLSTGLLFVFSQLQFEWLKIVDNYFTHIIPISIRISDVILVVIYSFVMTYAAARFPAKFALGKNLSEGLRYNS